MGAYLSRLPYTRDALVAGGSVFLLALAGAILINNVYSDTQARQLIEAMSSSAQTLCFAIITASAAIIPLMLTMLSFVHRLDQEFDLDFYRQIKVTVSTSAAALIISVLLLLMFSIPLIESDTLRSWFTVVYYILLGGVATVAALIVAVVSDALQDHERYYLGGAPTRR